MAPKKGCRVFLIEDDPDISKAVSFRLRKEGYETATFQNGVEGLQAAISQSPHLLILDLMLPGMSGEQICKSIREHEDEKIQEIPIIMLTAKNSEADGIVGRVIGANFYMTKPFSMEDLLSQIEKLLAVRPE